MVWPHGQRCCPFLIMCMVSMPAMMRPADVKES